MLGHGKGPRRAVLTSSVPLRCEQPAGAAESGLHFISDEECAVISARGAAFGEVAAWGHEDAALALRAIKSQSALRS